MLKKIESLRTQPKHIRNRYAFWTSLGVTFIIAIIWGVQLPNRFTPPEQVATATEESGSSFIHTFGEMISSLKQSLFNFRGTIEYARESTPADVFIPTTIDLRALVASSTQAQRKKEQATSPLQNQLPTAATDPQIKLPLPKRE